MLIIFACSTMVRASCLISCSFVVNVSGINSPLSLNENCEVVVPCGSREFAHLVGAVRPQRQSNPPDSSSHSRVVMNTGRVGRQLIAHPVCNLARLEID